MKWLADKLAAGLEAAVLELHLQPVVSLESEEIVGAESFIRWRDPDRGLVPPRDWIPLAESTGAIVACAVDCAAVVGGLLGSWNSDGGELQPRKSTVARQRLHR